MTMLAADLFDLSGQSALVTGASSGLGKQFARILSAHGAHVWLGARRLDKLHALKDDICQQGGLADVIELDVTDKSSIQTAFENIQSHHLNLSILVNNAGVATSGALLSQSDDDWRYVMDTNLDGVRQVGNAAAKLMIGQNTKGQIINIASILGFDVLKGLSAYAVAKAGVIQLTKAMALEFVRKGIHVNAIAPGYIKTEINADYFDSAQGLKMIDTIAMKRLGSPEELDATLLLLASRRANGFMTGSIITVDGGHLLGIV